MLIDTHCHIHESDYPLSATDVIKRAHEANVVKIICVGTCEKSSNEAIDFASKNEGVFASIGVHPHYADNANLNFITKSIQQNHKKLVAIGEIGLDYYYNNSPREDQIDILKKQIKIALEADLPIIFHVRDAYDDFWPILDEFISSGQQIRGVLHCFTGTLQDAKEAIKRGLYFGLNGISTFTKDDQQKVMFNSIPFDKILLETDAPLLTPYPLRGKVKVNEPAFIKEIAEYNGMARVVSFDEIASLTTKNACTLFKL
ncbi:MAG: TatD family hydrolase [Candidatus Saccharibacteria bacterium]